MDGVNQPSSSVSKFMFGEQELHDINQNVIATKNPVAFIDLTDDDLEVAPKRITANNREAFDVRVDDTAQPRTSRQLLGARPMKRGGCTKCGENSDNVEVVHLECQHRFCINCFIAALKANRRAVNLCPSPGCGAVIADYIIKRSLSHSADYISYLEHFRDNLRYALNPVINDILVLRPGGRLITPIEVTDSPSSVAEEQPKAIVIHRHSWLLQLQNLEAQPYVKNAEAIECSICFLQCDAGDGVTLKNCFHSFCKECICETIKYSDDPLIMCPGNTDAGGACEFYIQDREIRALASPELYEEYLNRALKRGETNLDNVVHCKTPDCIGFVEVDAAATAFVCEVCNTINCLKCKAIHEDKTCEEYKNDLLNDVKNQEELKQTEEAVKELVDKGEAMLCPNCGVLIQKDAGCDYVTCLSCKLGICYRTKKPRHPLQKIVNGVKVIIDGCHCMEKGKQCDPKCGNCH